MKVTIKDVAKKANVSPSTVSRVLSDSPRISTETKERVRKVMEELNYHPNSMARSLATNSSNVLGIVFPRSGNLAFQNPFFSDVLRGIMTSANENNFGIQLAAADDEAEILKSVKDMIRGRRVDGIIMLYSKENDQIIKFLHEVNFPFVMIGKPYDYEEKITHIDNDNVSAGEEGTNYLLKLGHRHIGFIGGNKKLMVTKNRLEGYKKALENNGIPFDPNYVKYEEFLVSGGKHGVEQLLSLKNPPTALLVTDDIMALGVLRTLKMMGQQVPTDLSILSFNNSMFAELSEPGLTSMEINIVEMGYHAVKNIIDKINHPKEPVKRVIIPHQLIIRSSCNQARE